MLLLILQLGMVAVMVATTWRLNHYCSNLLPLSVSEYSDIDPSGILRISIVTYASRSPNIYILGYGVFISLSLFTGLYVLTLGFLYKCVELIITQKIYRDNRNCNLFESAAIIVR